MRNVDPAWREKYLDVLDEKNLLEKRVKLQSDLLRRLLANLGAAIAGHDSSLDSSIVSLKEKLKGAKATVVLDQLDKLEACVKSYEERRNAEPKQLVRHLMCLSSSLRGLRLSESIRQQLTQFENVLNKQASHYIPPQQTRLFLQQLHELQESALQSASEEDKGLWQRLQTGRRIKKNSEQTGRESQEVISSSSAVDSVAEHEVFDNEFKVRVQRVIMHLANVVQSTIADDKILSTFTQLVDDPFSWDNLPIYMESIRDALIQTFLSEDSEFNQYLTKVNADLHEIALSLDSLISSSKSKYGSASEFEKSIAKEMTNIQHSLEHETNLEGLKNKVSHQLSSIHEALEDYQNASQHMTEQMEDLAEKIRNVEQEAKKSKALLEEERYRASHDELTGLPNRMAYNERFAQEWRRHQRYRRPLSLCVCDIDHFKAVNDTHGHAVGDEVLKSIATQIQERVREVDFVARYGGEEFVILLPETEAKDAEKVIDSVRKTVEHHDIVIDSVSLKITLSFGVTNLQLEDTVATAFERADKALYQAKDAGRNCYRVL